MVQHGIWTSTEAPLAGRVETLRTGEMEAARVAAEIEERRAAMAARDLTIRDARQALDARRLEAKETEVARVRDEAERALARIRAGEKFETVAREVSKGPSAEEGGDLGWIRGTVEKALEDAAFRLKEGEVSAVLRVGPGLPVLQAVDRRMGGGRPFDAAKEEIRERLSMEQFATYRDQYVAELRRGAAIQIHMPELDAAASK